jgi:hypothetical protein
MKPSTLAYGFTLGDRKWEPQVEYSTNRYRLINYDVRGYGKSLPLVLTSMEMVRANHSRALESNVERSDAAEQRSR